MLGIVSLVSGPYLVVVTRKAKLGQLCRHELWRVVETEISVLDTFKFLPL